MRSSPHPIRGVLRERDIPQGTFASGIDRSEGLVSRVITGQERPSAGFIAAACAYLGMEPEELFTFEQISRPVLRDGAA